MKAIVTGSSGFIGVHLVRKLKELQFEVIEWHHGDEMWDIEALLDENEKIDYIFHLSSYGNHTYQKEVNKIVKANVNDLIRILELTKDLHYKTFINFSTSAVILPYKTLYAATKEGGEAICKAYAQKYNKNIISIRPFSVYGPGEANFRFIPEVIKSIINDEVLKLVPDATHDWIYIDDFIDILLRIVGFGNFVTDKVVEIGTGISTSNSEIVYLLSDIAEITPQIEEVGQLREYDCLNWKANMDKINEYGFIPKYSLREGLVKTYEYYKQYFKEKNT